jgi:hypothetical protein
MTIAELIKLIKDHKIERMTILNGISGNSMLSSNFEMHINLKKEHSHPDPINKGFEVRMTVTQEAIDLLFESDLSEKLDRDIRMCVDNLDKACEDYNKRYKIKGKE